jgi:hypothetical protein
MSANQYPNWLGTAPTSNTQVVNGVAVNIVPNIVIDTGGVGYAALPTTNTAAYTGTQTLQPGTYIIYCEIYTAPPGSNWVAADYVTWQVGGTTGTSDTLIMTNLPFYTVGASFTLVQNMTGLIKLGSATTIKIQPTYSITNAGAQYVITSLAWQKIA